MSGSSSGTLNAGIGGPPPRPSASLSVGANPVAAVSFSVSQDFTYTTNGVYTVGGVLDAQINTDSNADFIALISVDTSSSGSTGLAPGLIQCAGNLISGSRTFSVVVPTAPVAGNTVANCLSASGTIRLYQLVRPGYIFSIPQTNLCAYVTLNTPAGVTVISQANVPVSSSASVAITSIESALDAGIMHYTQSISEVDVSETITLNPIADVAYDAATDGAVLFAISGTNSGAVQMQNMLIVVDEANEQINTHNGAYQAILPLSGNGDSFSPGSSWSANIGAGDPYLHEPRVFGLGAHTLRVVDADWGVYSNMVTFNVTSSGGTGGGGPQLYLNPVIATDGVAPPISGTDSETPNASALDYQVDGGPWIIGGVGRFQPATTNGGLWLGTGPAEGPGIHTLTVRNTGQPYVVSNTQTYVIAASSSTPIPGYSYVTQQVIWTNAQGASAWCTYDVEDPNAWEPGFVNALSWYLAAEMAVSITGSAQVQEAMMAGAREALAKASMTEGNEETQIASWNADWVDGRDGFSSAYGYGDGWSSR
jgi:hypothetical protein